MLFNATLITVIASLVIYAYGLLSFATSIAFLCISFCVTAIAFLKLKTNLEAKHDELESTQQKHRHFGIYYRSYTDDDGDLWLNYSDIKQQIPAVKSSNIMRMLYPKHFQKANPNSDAWYVHPQVLRVMVGNNISESTNSIIVFLENKVIAQHLAEKQLSKHLKKEKKSKPPKKSWLHRYWNGEFGPIITLLTGMAALFIARFSFEALMPENITAHYQALAITYLSSIVVNSLILLYCGHGVFLSAQRWMFSSRSLLVALLSICGGLYLFVYSLQPFTSKYAQYSIAEFLIIATDSDKKAEIDYDPSSQSIFINGDLGFGVSNKLKQVMAEHPNIKLLALRSPGGKSAEGNAIYHLVKENRMDTLVWDKCASACVDVYIAGKNRYITNTAEFGLHRSGHHWDDRDSGPSAEDLYFAELQRKAGVAEWLIQRGLEPSIHGLYEPSPQEAFDGRLATAWWEKEIPAL